MSVRPRVRLSRRELLALGGVGSMLAGCSPRPSAAVSAASPVDLAPVFVQSGDVDATSVMVWARAQARSRGAPLVVDLARAEDHDFSRARRFIGPTASEVTDSCAQLMLPRLDAGTAYRYRARFGEHARTYAEGLVRTASQDDRDLLFAWSGDTVGQGWGIDRARGGLTTYRTMHETPSIDAFFHVGDMIYADGVVLPEVALPDGTLWKNLVVPAKSHVAETLDDFRGAFAYPSNCEHFRAFARDVPLYAIWDDHEVWNDFWPSQVTSDPRYGEKRAEVIAARAFRAMHEHVPFRPSATMYRKVSWGAGAELFFLDGRSHRSPDGANDEPGGSAFFGDAQIAWLVEGLTASRSTWKIIATDMPIGLVLPHAYAAGGVPLSFDGIAQGDGPPLGRELEIAKVLAACRKAGVRNLLFLTADVHYAALHRFDPERAVYKDFNAFHECIAGPLHASSFPPKKTDSTFGCEVLFQVEEPVQSGSGPAAGRQSFGLVAIAKGTHEATVTFVSGTGNVLHRARLAPAAR